LSKYPPPTCAQTKETSSSVSRSNINLKKNVFYLALANVKDSNVILLPEEEDFEYIDSLLFVINSLFNHN